ncbi:MAG: type II toxin-antitoxin system RelE/ParE family toxin [Rhodocyclaceae bacterium]|nr:type II toxin-antitoxin system RelE/ParE family toxin [Rhodocyclaceae bacterium]MBX3677256.1 type II toxin-antitoxin system RelE/ParE family toxin [Rhodocyclaceae bacterium]MCP5297663.1 type II toxin-antitoxin system RelE/ParE family toxin [Zoogloeaceae bacterium]
MLEIIQSETFARWLDKLKDRQAVAKINARIQRLSTTGHFGDVKPVREGISELRIDHGPGYRLYFMKRGAILVVLLAGGDKSSQTTDIKHAIAISKEWRD